MLKNARLKAFLCDFCAPLTCDYAVPFSVWCISVLVSGNPKKTHTNSNFIGYDTPLNRKINSSNDDQEEGQYFFQVGAHHIQSQEGR